LSRVKKIISYACVVKRRKTTGVLFGGSLLAGGSFKLAGVKVIIKTLFFV
jgi:hypothetical protein